MPDITNNVSFDTIAREWRCKWTPENEKESLVQLQNLLNKYADQLKNVKGFKKLQRIVCGGCMDFKVITSLSADSFEEWSEKSFKPEAEFLEAMKKIDGVSTVETQTYTIMEC